MNYIFCAFLQYEQALTVSLLGSLPLPQPNVDAIVVLTLFFWVNYTFRTRQRLT